MNYNYLRLCLLLTLLCFMVSTNAQRSYRFEATTQTYAELNNATVVPWSAFNPSTDLYTLMELNGETFWFYKVPFPFGGVKTFAIQSNGNIRVDNDSTLMIIDGVFTFLDSIDATSSVSYRIEGNAGNKIVKGQWRNLKIRVGNAVNFVNFQIWVYQQSGIVEIHYGTSSANNQSGYQINSGPQVGMFFSEDDFTRCYEKLWVNGSPSNYTLDSASTYSFKAMSGVPVGGTVFRFIPRFGITGISKVMHTSDPMNIYPNPISGNLLFVNLKDDYRIMDMHGKQILHTLKTDAIDISVLKEGIYLLQRTDGKSQRFIVE